MPDKFKIRVGKHVPDIILASCKKIVYADYLVPLF
jgi:hypothetical protein